MCIFVLKSKHLTLWVTISGGMWYPYMSIYKGIKIVDNFFSFVLFSSLNISFFHSIYLERKDVKFSTSHHIFHNALLKDITLPHIAFIIHFFCPFQLHLFSYSLICSFSRLKCVSLFLSTASFTSECIFIVCFVVVVIVVVALQSANLLIRLHFTMRVLVCVGG
jgi:hypothetical protein